MKKKKPGRGPVDFEGMWRVIAKHKKSRTSYAMPDHETREKNTGDVSAEYLENLGDRFGVFAAKNRESRKKP